MGTGTISGMGSGSPASRPRTGRRRAQVVVGFRFEVGGDLVDELDPGGPDVVVDGVELPRGRLDVGQGIEDVAGGEDPCARPFAISPASPASGRPSRSSEDG